MFLNKYDLKKSYDHPTPFSLIIRLKKWQRNGVGPAADRFFRIAAKEEIYFAIDIL
jgi:hypothetical protein